MAILGTRMPLPSSTPLARDKGKSGSSEIPPPKLLDPRSTRALKIFACKPLVFIESIRSAGQTRGSWQPGHMLTVAVFRNSPVQQFKQKTNFLCISAPCISSVSEAQKRADADSWGCTNQSPDAALSSWQHFGSLRDAILCILLPFLWFFSSAAKRGFACSSGQPECCRAQPGERERLAAPPQQATGV